jgi:hypothetical protein
MEWNKRKQSSFTSFTMTLQAPLLLVFKSIKAATSPSTKTPEQRLSSSGMLLRKQVWVTAAKVHLKDETPTAVKLLQLVMQAISEWTDATNTLGRISVDYTAPKARFGSLYNSGYQTGDVNDFYEDTGTTAKFYWDASAESLGIGTTSPTAKLHVGAVSSLTGNLSPTAVIIGDINTSGSEETTLGIYQGGTSVGSAVGLVAGVTSGASPYFAIKTRPTAGGDSIERLRIDSSGTTSLRNAPAGNALQFGTTSGVTYTERARVGINASNGLDFAVNGTSPDVTINTSGYVGIGTSSPTNQLHITATNPTVYLETSGGGATDSAFVQKFSNDFYIWNKEVAGNLFLGTNNSTKLTIDSSGNVGIGTSVTTDAKTTISLAGVAVSGNTDGATIGASGIVNLYNSTGTVTNSTIMLLGSTSSSTAGRIASGIGFSRENSSGWGTQLRFYTHSTATSDIDELLERMRIDLQWQCWYW